MARPHAVQQRAGGRDSPLQTSQSIASRLSATDAAHGLVRGAQAILDKGHKDVGHVVSPLRGQVMGADAVDGCSIVAVAGSPLPSRFSCAAAVG
jgi:hypothetical protein